MNGDDTPPPTHTHTHANICKKRLSLVLLYSFVERLVRGRVCGNTNTKTTQNKTKDVCREAHNLLKRLLVVERACNVLLRRCIIIISRLSTTSSSGPEGKNRRRFSSKRRRFNSKRRRFNYKRRRNCGLLTGEKRFTTLASVSAALFCRTRRHAFWRPHRVVLRVPHPTAGPGIILLAFHFVFAMMSRAGGVCHAGGGVRLHQEHQEYPYQGVSERWICILVLSVI